MNKMPLVAVAAFIFGGAAGSAATYFIVKNRFEKKSDDEINSVKEHLKKHYENKKEITTRNGHSKKAKKEASDQKEVDVPKDVPGYMDYSKLAKPYNKADDGTAPKKDQGSSKKIISAPYVISPSEYSNSEYDCVTLIYYADKVLADDDYNVISNPKDIVGPDALSSFGQYDPDVVYVRDDIAQKDYEIILSNDKYSEVASLQGDREPLDPAN